MLIWTNSSGTDKKSAKYLMPYASKLGQVLCVIACDIFRARRLLLSSLLLDNEVMCPEQKKPK